MNIAECAAALRASRVFPCQHTLNEFRRLSQCRVRRYSRGVTASPSSAGRNCSLLITAKRVRGQRHQTNILLYIHITHSLLTSVGIHTTSTACRKELGAAV
eukprot:427543-Hanusia_phi.AAC.2